jgi:hypothetical protein
MEQCPACLHGLTHKKLATAYGFMLPMGMRFVQVDQRQRQ